MIVLNQVDQISKTLWQQLIKTFQKSCQISSVEQNEVNFISSSCRSENEIKSEAIISLKAKSNCILIQAYGVGNLSKYKQKMNYLQIIQKLNQDLCKQDVIFWVEENNNFGMRRVIPYDIFNSYNSSQATKYFELTKKTLQQNINRCIRQVKENSDRQTGYILKKKLNNLQHIKYQIQANRSKRAKATKMDFNTSKIKSIVQMIQMKQYCTKYSRNFHQILKQSRYKNQINPKQALQLFTKKKNDMEQKIKQANIKVINEGQKKILYAIQILQETQLNNDIIPGSFSHIQVVQSKYRILFSTKLGTNLHVSQQKGQNVLIKQETSILVKKKCSIYHGQTQSSTNNINQQVFQNQKEMLIILNQKQSSSICNYFIQQYQNLKQIDTIYCRKLPYDPIKIYFLGRKNPQSLQFMRNILKFLIQVAEGIQFLYQNKIVHRDLKPANIMLNNQFSPKIIDFGSSCPEMNSTVCLSDTFDLTLRSTKDYYIKYQNLHRQIKNKYTKQQYQRHYCFDIYSFGVIAQHLVRKVHKSESLLIVSFIQNMQYVIQKCKDPHPDDRILPSQVCLILTQIYSLILKVNC